MSPTRKPAWLQARSRPSLPPAFPGSTSSPCRFEQIVHPAKVLPVVPPLPGALDLQRNAALDSGQGVQRLSPVAGCARF